MFRNLSLIPLMTRSLTPAQDRLWSQDQSHKCSTATVLHRPEVHSIYLTLFCLCLIIISFTKSHSLNFYELVRRDVGLWNPIEPAENLKIKKEDEEDDIAVDDMEDERDERHREESEEDTGSRSSPGSGSNLPHDQVSNLQSSRMNF